MSGMRLVGQLSADGQITLVRRVERFEDEVYDVAAKLLETREHKGSELLLIPEGLAVVVTLMPRGKFQSRGKGSCEYVAIKQYLANHNGVFLCDEDNDFFQDHPLVIGEGVPMQHTLRVAQELIEPYGLRISRVVAKPGVGLMGDLMQWTQVLGLNPNAMFDWATSNEDFAKQHNLDPAVVSKQFRFEFADVELRPSIGCGATVGQPGQTHVHGHASYRSPRRKFYGGKADGYVLQFQIAKADETQWYQDPVFAALVEEEVKPEQRLSIYLSHPPGQPDKTFDDITPKTGFFGLRNKRTTTTEEVTPQQLSREFGAVYSKLWRGWSCHNCKQDFAKATPKLDNVAENSVSAFCIKCDKINHLAEKDDKQVAVVVRAYKALKALEDKGEVTTVEHNTGHHYIPAPQPDVRLVRRDSKLCSACEVELNLTVAQERGTRDICTPCWDRVCSWLTCPKPQCNKPGATFTYSGAVKRDGKWAAIVRCSVCRDVIQHTGTPVSEAFAVAVLGYNLTTTERQLLATLPPARGEADVATELQ